MGRLIANWDSIGFEKTIQSYEELFKKTFSKNPTVNAHINVLQHIYGYFPDMLKVGEKRQFNNLLNKLKDIGIYLASQKYLNPYPEEL